MASNAFSSKAAGIARGLVFHKRTPPHPRPHETGQRPHTAPPSIRKGGFPHAKSRALRLYGLRQNHGGRLLAARTGRRFVDTDALIEEEAGMAVEDIFNRFGEEDFRLRERQVCARLAEKEGW